MEGERKKETGTGTGTGTVDPASHVGLSDDLSLSNTDLVLRVFILTKYLSPLNIFPMNPLALFTLFAPAWRPMPARSLKLVPPRTLTLIIPVLWGSTPLLAVM